MFLNLIRSECIKYRHTLLVVTIGLAPLLAAALSIYSEFDNDFHWNHILRTAGLLWFGGWIPMICSLLAGFACQLEKGAGNWKGLLVRPVSPKLVYFSKLFVLVIQMTLSTALLFIILNIASLFFPDQEPVPWLKWGGDVDSSNALIHEYSFSFILDCGCVGTYNSSGIWIFLRYMFWIVEDDQRLGEGRNSILLNGNSNSFCNSRLCCHFIFQFSLV